MNRNKVRGNYLMWYFGGLGKHENEREGMNHENEGEGLGF